MPSPFPGMDPSSSLAAIRSKLTTFKQLDPAVRSPLLQALALLPLVHHALKVLGFQRTYSLLQTLSEVSAAVPPTELSSVDAEETALRSTAQAVRLAGRYHPYATCLRRSLVLWYLLRRRGLMAALQIGTRFHEGEFQAHAWVTYGGKIVGDRPDIAQHFHPFDTLNPTLNSFIRSL